MEKRMRRGADALVRNWESVLMVAGMTALVLLGTMQAMRGMSY